MVKNVLFLKIDDWNFNLRRANNELLWLSGGVY